MFGIGPGYMPTLKRTTAAIKQFSSSMAVFADRSADGGAEAAEGASDFRALGGKATVELYPTSATTFKPEVQDAISKGAQALWFTACGPQAITGVGEAKQLGFKGKIMLENCLASYDIAKALKGLASGQQIVVLSPYSLVPTPAPDPAERSAISLYKSQIPGPVNTVESAGWDSMMVVAKAIEAAHSTSTPTLLSTLNNGFSYTGVWHSGRFTSQDHRGATTTGYTALTYFTPQGTIQLLSTK
jgi:ABC-type branched-subunit amino acid transport system substrate-binding protein